MESIRALLESTHLVDREGGEKAIHLARHEGVCQHILLSVLGLGVVDDQAE